MSTDFTFKINSTTLDEHYQPADNTRATTNFANLARGEKRQDNLRNALKMIDNRFNRLASWDNPKGDRYSVELEIISVEMDLEKSGHSFPSIEMLKTNIVDHTTGQRIEGIVGNNFSSYIRDYDFSILLSAHNKDKPSFTAPENFGELHGKLFQSFLNSSAYKAHFSKKPVICLSVAETKTYQRVGNQHPILGVEYLPNASSLTEQYFNKMGLQVRYFMPQQATAPLAFYFMGDLLNDYSNLELLSTISTMETFQKIYRPEIYNANTVAGETYQPNLQHLDYSLTHIVYDREERNRLGIAQGKFAEQHFIKPHQKLFEQLNTQAVCLA
ncbi:DUF1852 domain-containing protein [Psychromonas sp. B3M02]|uniref:DUF1852 domain-containing protein n=1 Tax=Psychromonas sp. B3M02 TaxID=2267226 RepID=UPI000DEA7C70|nr:DUF1852 domain-containing protein [Psychromonas sp. B3M02]RBW46491.1 DUF1852 domain-containing protein [Psychromonas sp. B3M02]